MGRHDSSEHCSPLRFVNATTLCSCNWCVRWPHPLLRTLSISLWSISKVIVRFHSWDSFSKIRFVNFVNDPYLKSYLITDSRLIEKIKCLHEMVEK